MITMRSSTLTHISRPHALARHSRSVSSVMRIVATVVKTCGNSATDILGLALEPVVPLLAASEHAAALLEVVEGDGRKDGCFVVDCGVVVGFVDWDRGVDYAWLDGFLVDDGLDGFVDVVVDVLACYGGGGALACCGVFDYAIAFESGLFGGEGTFVLIVVSVVEFAVLD